MAQRYLRFAFRLMLGILFFNILLQDPAQAQIIQDLSSVRVDDLSDAQVKQFLEQVQATGLSDAQLEQVASARGMRTSEIAKLRERVDKLGAGRTREPSRTPVNSRLMRGTDAADTLFYQQRDLREEVDVLFDNLKPSIYGHELFRNAHPQFVSNLKVATPQSYVVGPGDELLIDIYGDSEASYQLTVSLEGRINIPYVGVVSVGGTTIEQVTSRIENRLSSIYSGISTGRTQIGVSLGEIRSIQVVMTGELVQPGTYTLPSVVTVFNALHAAGGPSENGSLRNIKVYRNNSLVTELDVYDFLLHGSLEHNITLQDQDIVQVSPADQRVFIAGEVHRPMYYDAHTGDSFADLIRYAGGFTNQAYTQRVSVERMTKRERRVVDVLETQYGHFQLLSGDRFHVGAILDRFENRVQILGAVYNPGVYELTSGLSLSMLIKKADGVKDDAFMNFGYIDRRKENTEPERIHFNVAEVLAGTQTDIALQREDVVHISSIFDLKDEQTIRIEGEVRSPGSFSYAEGMTIQDLLIQAGGFKESASPKRIEVSRRVVDADPLDQSAHTAEVFHIDLEKDLTKVSEAIDLQPFDFVTIRAQSGYESQKNVRIEGEVLYPGIYTITSKEERISDIIARAGGLTAYAYTKGASLKRRGIQARSEVKSTDAISESEKFEDQQELQEDAQYRKQVTSLIADDSSLDESAALQQSMRNDYVGVRFDEILKDESVHDNILLEEGDVIYIPKQLQTVRVSGEVLSPVNTVYREHASFKEYISQAGGFSPQALRKRAYIVYANGSARSTKSFLGIKTYPKVEPGAEIFVPQRTERERLSPQAWIGMGTGVASIAAIIVSLLR